MGDRCFREFGEGKDLEDVWNNYDDLYACNSALRPHPLRIISGGTLKSGLLSSHNLLSLGICDNDGGTVLILLFLKIEIFQLFQFCDRIWNLADLVSAEAEIL